MTIEVYAVVDSKGAVVSTTVWDGEAEWVPPDGTTAIKVGDSGAGIGCTYKDGVFTPPAAPEVPNDELVVQAEQQKANLISEANQAISILQDAVDLDMATDEEKEQLTAWKKYRVLLSRIDVSATEVEDWPIPPTE